MESKAIIKHLKADTNFVTFVGSITQLFAKMGQGNMSITGKADKKPVDAGIPKVFSSILEFEINGFELEKGEEIGDRVVTIVKGLKRSTVTDSKKNYVVKSVSPTNGPTFIKWKENKSFSVNFRLNYREEAV